MMQMKNMVEIQPLQQRKYVHHQEKQKIRGGLERILRRTVKTQKRT